VFSVERMLGVENAALENAGLENVGIKNMASVEWLN